MSLLCIFKSYIQKYCNDSAASGQKEKVWSTEDSSESSYCLKKKKKSCCNVNRISMYETCCLSWARLYCCFLFIGSFHPAAMLLLLFQHMWGDVQFCFVILAAISSLLSSQDPKERFQGAQRIMMFFEKLNRRLKVDSLDWFLIRPRVVMLLSVW